LKLAYESDELLPELKSLKFYFLSYRDREILHEELANEILDDFVSAVKPRWVQLILKVNNRGGVFTTIGRRWSRERGDESVDLKKLEAD
jgi:7-cyano-7-deazaguanine reductase